MSQPSNPQIILQLLNFTTKLTKRIEGQLWVHGLNLTEYLVLYHLSQETGGHLRRIDLAERTGRSASGITRLLAPMEKIGLVQKEKNPRDARVSLVSLTEAGRRVFREAETSFNHCADTLTRDLDADHRTELVDRVNAML